MTLVDSHCHLDYPELQKDFPGVLARARSAGVETMLAIGTRLSTFENVRKIAETTPNVFCTVGIHPHEAANETAAVDALLAHAAHPKVVGIGETGLDYFYEKSPREPQRENFRAHLRAATVTQEQREARARRGDHRRRGVKFDPGGSPHFHGRERRREQVKKTEPVPRLRLSMRMFQYMTL